MAGILPQMNTSLLDYTFLFSSPNLYGLPRFITILHSVSPCLVCLETLLTALQNALGIRAFSIISMASSVGLWLSSAVWTTAVASEGAIPFHLRFPATYSEHGAKGLSRPQTYYITSIQNLPMFPGSFKWRS